MLAVADNNYNDESTNFNSIDFSDTRSRVLDNLSASKKLAKEISKEITLMGVKVCDMFLNFRNPESIETFFLVDEENYDNPDLIIKAYSKAREIKRDLMNLDFDISFAFRKMGDKKSESEILGAVSVDNVKG